MSQDIYKVQWSEYVNQVHQHWSKLTDDDLSRLNRGADDLIQALRKRYGYGKAQAEIEISNWLNDINPNASQKKQ